MKHLRLFEQFDNIIFVRNNKFDNSGTIRKLPYDGIQCWAIYSSDYDKYITELELWGGNRKDVEIIDPNNKEIFAIDYSKAHRYVMGEREELPQLEVYNPDIHIMRFKKNDGKSMLEYSAEMKYQIIIK